MISGADVALAARATLAAHLPAVLARGVNGRAALPAPESYNMVATLEAIRFVKGAVIAVSAPRTVSNERFGDLTYDASWLLAVAVWHGQTSLLPLDTAAPDYIACIRGCLLQNPTLGGFASELTWTEESTDIVGDELTPSTLGFGVCEFIVRVPGVATEEPQVSLDGPLAVESTVFVNP